MDLHVSEAGLHGPLSEAEKVHAGHLLLDDLQARHGRVWSPIQLRDDFTVVCWAAPYVVVRDKRTKRLASLLYQHEPRFYFALEHATD